MLLSSLDQLRQCFVADNRGSRLTEVPVFECYFCHIDSPVLLWYNGR